MASRVWWKAGVGCQRVGSLSGSVVVSGCRVLRLRGRPDS